MQQPTFINQFQKGSSENANLGYGVMLGVETYTNKGLAQLAKKASKVSGTIITDLPVFVVNGSDDSKIYAQARDGSVYYSSDTGATWTDMTNGNGGSSGTGHGLVWFQGYLFAIRGSKIDFTSGTTTSWTQTNWQPNGASPGIYSSSGICPSFIFPNDNFVYIGNGSKVIKLGFGTDPTFDPTGTGATDYFYDKNWGGNVYGGLLPSFYQITSISFLPTNYIALGTSSTKNSAVADIILWNPTLSTYETPLRLYSQAPTDQNGVKQLINRNNVLYAVVGGSGTIFQTNGTSFSEVANLSLYSNIRKTTGMQSQLPVFINPRVSAIDVFGNKLLTGVSNSSSTYPSGYGLYPCGVWSVAFMPDGNAVQCEYTISTGTTVAVNKFVEIGFVKCVNSNQTLISWRDGSTHGIDLVSTSNFQDTISTVSIESEMMEIGTPLEPETIQTIQLNTPRQLLTGQTVTFNYRTGFDQDYTTLQSFTSANNNDNGYKITGNEIGTTRFLQLQVQMASTSDLTYSPVIRNIIITP